MPVAVPGDFCGGYHRSPDETCTQAVVPGVFWDRSVKECRWANAPDGCSRPPFKSISECEDAVKNRRCDLSQLPAPTTGWLKCESGTNGFRVEFTAGHRSVKLWKDRELKEELVCNAKLQCANQMDGGYLVSAELAPASGRSWVRVWKQNIGGDSVLDSMNCAGSNSASCDAIRPTEAGTTGGPGNITGYFFDRTSRRCEETRDYGSASPRGPFSTREECEAAARGGRCG